jgi:hypothetical protein
MAVRMFLDFQPGLPTHSASKSLDSLLDSGLVVVEAERLSNHVSDPVRGTEIFTVTANGEPIPYFLDVLTVKAIARFGRIPHSHLADFPLGQ